MSSLKTFIDALRTGETRTTKALNRLVARRRSAHAETLISLLQERGALATPLQRPFRDAVRGLPLPERYIQGCIDAWPDAQKERIRRALVSAIKAGHPVQFAWGITPAGSFRTDISHTPSGRVTITALTPRSSLRARPGAVVAVMP